MPKHQHHSLREFLQDARGTFNAFTLAALQAGFTLVSAPLVCRVMSWPALSQPEISALTLVYCISALSDAALSIFLNKMPSTVIQNTDGGDAGAAFGPAATNNAPGPATDASQSQNPAAPQEASS